MSADPSSAEYKRRVRELNDALRRHLEGGQWLLTVGVVSLPTTQAMAAIRAVRAFDAFTPENDPHGEHDGALIEIDGMRFIWRIDYHDLELEYGSPDPADPKVTRRALVLMLAEEY